MGQARNILHHLVEAGSASVSTQTLSEFFTTITRRITIRLPLDKAYEHLEILIATFHVYEVTPITVLEAARATRDYQMSFWDAQIWAIAKVNQIRFVLTEDLPGREMLEGVYFINPFQDHAKFMSLLKGDFRS